MRMFSSFDVSIVQGISENGVCYNEDQRSFVSDLTIHLHTTSGKSLQSDSSAVIHFNKENVSFTCGYLFSIHLSSLAYVSSNITSYIACSYI